MLCPASCHVCRIGKRGGTLKPSPVETQKLRDGLQGGGMKLSPKDSAGRFYRV